VCANAHSDFKSSLEMMTFLVAPVKPILRRLMNRTFAFANCVIAVLFCGMSTQAQQANTALAALAQTTATRTLPPPGTVTGTGTANYIPEWTGSTTLGNSVLYQTGGRIGVNMTSPAVELDVNGRVNVSKSYRIGGSDVLVTSGQSVGVGIGALQSQGIGTFYNTAVGASALATNTSGGANTGLGNEALYYNNGAYNTAVGFVALKSNTSGISNTAVGQAAAAGSSTGSYNTAVGDSTLWYNFTGSSNIAIGYQSGFYTNGSNNIDVANYGAATDNGVVRIGISGTQTSFFAAGIRGVTTGSNDAVPVMIDSNGQLGTVSSSRRFKQDIQDMGDASQGLMRLRPVKFRYLKPFADGSKPMQYGLVAEEVAEVYPDLVARSADGQIETVKYQVLDSMLLNEVQRQQAEIRSKNAEIRSLQERLEKIEGMITPLSQTAEQHGALAATK
jgi:Chaperone of endosialidase